MSTNLFFSTVPLLVFLVAALTDASTDNLWNIDCGASTGYSTGYNLSWIGDGDYVRTGESYDVPNTTTMATRLQTLRSFPIGKKNCFTVPVGADRKIRVTLDFAYNNYDGLSTPPEFGVLFDSYKWGVLQTSGDLPPGYYEYITVVYVTRSSNTSICFGREADDQIPFINALQVSALDPGMYPEVNSSVVLNERRRLAFGANTTIRYPDDPYDRVWREAAAAVEGFNYTTVVNNGTGILNTSSSVDNPPSKLFHTAAAPPEGETNLTIRAPYITTGFLYFNMYFTEFSDLSPSKLHRTFHVFLGDTLLTSNPVVAPFNRVLELSGLAPASANTKFTLVPADNSSLPPVISGFEVLSIRGFMTSNGTSSEDVDALTILQDKFPVLQNWTGDPCLPETYNWEWVNCSSDEPPRITALSLGGYGLSGSLPDFSGLDALVTIDLHNNSLTGVIPGFLGKFPNLKNLNLAYNNFSGAIPPSLANNPKIRSFNITGNPLLENKEPPPPPSSPNSDPTLPSDGNGCVRFSGSALVTILIALVAAVVP